MAIARDVQLSFAESNSDAPHGASIETRVGAAYRDRGEHITVTAG